MTDQGTARLYAVGEFDTLNSRLLEASIRQALADGFSPVLLDFSRVAFMDVSVVHALVRSWDVAAEHGCILRIVDPSEAASLILDASGTRPILSPDQAAEDAAVGPGRGPESLLERPMPEWHVSACRHLK
jgi:anti-anti-sigma factor